MFTSLEDLSWFLDSSSLAKKGQQCLYFLSKLKKACLSPQVLVNFYRCTIESILTYCITVWIESCSKGDRKAQHVISTLLPAISDLQSVSCLRLEILHTPTMDFALFPSGRRYRSFIPAGSEAAFNIIPSPCLTQKPVSNSKLFFVCTYFMLHKNGYHPIHSHM